MPLDPVLSSIRMCDGGDAPAFAEHFARNFATSGKDGTPIFSVYSRRREVNIPDKIVRARESWARPTSQIGWERSWAAFESAKNGDVQIVGEVTLLTSRQVETQLHRAMLGMGVEPGYRHRGIGKALLGAALAWAEQQMFLEWIDLGVFSENAAARALYRSFSFIETGRTVDSFRVDGHKLDDIQMTLNLRSHVKSLKE
jgi:RimJ/RimL family protein N-acetyltransferase